MDCKSLKSSAVVIFLYNMAIYTFQSFLAAKNYTFQYDIALQKYTFQLIQTNRQKIF